MDMKPKRIVKMNEMIMMDGGQTEYRSYADAI